MRDYQISPEEIQAAYAEKKAARRQRKTTQSASVVRVANSFSSDGENRIFAPVIFAGVLRLAVYEGKSFALLLAGRP